MIHFTGQQPWDIREYHALQVQILLGCVFSRVAVRGGVDWQFSSMVELQLGTDLARHACLGQQEDEVGILTPPWYEFNLPAQGVAHGASALKTIIYVQ